MERSDVIEVFLHGAILMVARFRAGSRVSLNARAKSLVGRLGYALFLDGVFH